MLLYSNSRITEAKETLRAEMALGFERMMSAIKGLENKLENQMKGLENKLENQMKDLENKLENQIKGLENKLEIHELEHHRK